MTRSGLLLFQSSFFVSCLLGQASAKSLQDLTVEGYEVKTGYFALTDQMGASPFHILFLQKQSSVFICESRANILEKIGPQFEVDKLKNLYICTQVAQ